ncbi:MAG: SRPBCC family protein [Actinobacteria bacterium]|nr:SRPBCC family protein [Actinomycetota bacterium]
MQLEHSFTVPAPPAEAFAVLRDIERIGPCMPGAAIESVDGDSFTGSVKVKVGPIQLTYRGDAEYVDVDPDALTAVIEARGKEQRGSGTAAATVRAQLAAHPDGTKIDVVTDLAVTGKPAQFGRGVLADVGSKLIGEFAHCLADQLGPRPEPQAVTADQQPSREPAGATAGPWDEARPEGIADDLYQVEPEAVDLLSVAGGPVLRRVAPILGILLLLWVVYRLVRHD